MMIFFLLVIFTSQAYASDYTQLRDAGKKSLYEGNFAEAKFKFEGAEGFAISSSEVAEIKALQSVLKDSINKVFDRAYGLMGINSETAILLFERLYDKQGKSMHNNLNAQLGWCYGKQKMKTKERQLYNIGVKEGESVAAYYLARLLDNNEISNDSIIQLYKMAYNISSAQDSLGMIYYRQRNYNESYKWFRKNHTVLGDYYKATMLLDNTISLLLLNDYKNDQPIQFLENSSNVKNIDLAKSENAPALYYLGLLYYYAKANDIVRQDKLLGKRLIKKASDLGYVPAKKIIYSL